MSSTAVQRFWAIKFGVFFEAEVGAATGRDAAVLVGANESVGFIIILTLQIGDVVINSGFWQGSGAGARFKG